MNGALSNHTDVQVQHVKYMRAGHIALTIHTPGSISQILVFSDIPKGCLGH